MIVTSSSDLNISLQNFLKNSVYSLILLSIEKENIIERVQAAIQGLEFFL